MKLKIYTRIVFALALCGASLFGQTVSSSLEGVVVDQSNAAVVGAAVTLTNPSTQSSRTAVTDNNGTYRFLQIDPATYNVTVKASGFKTQTQTGIAVSAQETHNGGRMILTVGSLSESISVTAEAAVENTASAMLQ